MSLRSQVLQVVDAGTEQLGFAPSLRMEGLLDTLVSDELAAQVLASLREALSNAARHAEATSVEVRLAVDDVSLELEVSDDGKGITGGGRRSGLANLAARAAQVGGRFDVTSGPEGGTELLWTADLSGVDQPD